jgi:hypothetical protein
MRNSIGRRKDVERRALPTPERMRRAGADVERGHSGQITMRDAPLERAFARNAITAEQYSAGQKYRHHWYHAGLAGRRSWVPSISAFTRVFDALCAGTTACDSAVLRIRAAAPASARSTGFGSAPS